MEAAVGDAQQLVAAEAEGRLRKLGNWSLGESLTHVAFWANAPFDGYPPDLKVPWLLKFVMKFMRAGMINQGLRPGVKIPRAPGGTYGAEDLPAAEALERLRAAFGRLDRQCPAGPNPLLGAMTHDEWKQFNLRHAELHLSFYQPE